MFEAILHGIVGIKCVFSYVCFHFIKLLYFSQGVLCLFRMIIQCFLEVAARMRPACDRLSLRIKEVDML